jgi:hypothetical protein
MQTRAIHVAQGLRGHHLNPLPTRRLHIRCLSRQGAGGEPRYLLEAMIQRPNEHIERVVWPTLGFKSFRSARTTSQGLELMHLINKGQMVSDSGENLSAAEQLYLLAA